MDEDDQDDHGEYAHDQNDDADGSYGDDKDDDEKGLDNRQLLGGRAWRRNCCKQFDHNLLLEGWKLSSHFSTGHHQL